MIGRCIKEGLKACGECYWWYNHATEIKIAEMDSLFSAICQMDKFEKKMQKMSNREFKKAAVWYLKNDYQREHFMAIVSNYPDKKEIVQSLLLLL